jgi:hypothetical protein
VAEGKGDCQKYQLFNATNPTIDTTTESLNGTSHRIGGAQVFLQDSMEFGLRSLITTPGKSDKKKPLDPLSVQEWNLIKKILPWQPLPFSSSRLMSPILLAAIFLDPRLKDFADIDDPNQRKMYPKGRGFLRGTQPTNCETCIRTTNDSPTVDFVK